MNSATHTISVGHAVAKLSYVDRVGPEQLAQLQANPAFGDEQAMCLITYHAVRYQFTEFAPPHVSFMVCYKTLSVVGG